VINEEEKPMSQQRKLFEAEALFLNPDDVPNAIKALAMFGFTYTVDPEAIDEHGPTVFGWITGTTGLSDDDLGDRLLDIVTPLGGEIVTWGYVEKPIDASHLRCITCGKPIPSGCHCGECVDRGLAPCTACEGLSLAELDGEDAS